MKPVRFTLALTYTTIALSVLGVALGIWHRAQEQMWSQMQDVRLEYNLLGAGVIALAVAAAGGLRLRREWGRTLALSLCLVVAFLYLGIRYIVAPAMTGLPLKSFLNLESIVMGGLAIANAVALSRAQFRDAYSAGASTTEVPR